MPRFKHSGAIGDVIYSLPTVRGLGGGVMYFPTGKPSHFWNAFYGDPNPILARLVLAQPYIQGVEAFTGQEIDYDLGKFRKAFGSAMFVETMSLCDMHLRTFGLPLSERDRPWIHVQPRALPEGKDVIFCRSSRYASPFFRWQRIWEEYGSRAVFCGLPVEHQEFQDKLGVTVPHLPTRDLLDLAEYIASCSLFVGNQSSPFALAEGLKKNAILEVCPDCPNCLFHREGLQAYTVY